MGAAEETRVVVVEVEVHVRIASLQHRTTTRPDPDLQGGYDVVFR